MPLERKMPLRLCPLPGMFRLWCKKVTDLVHHHANERFAKIEHGWITLVNNHEHLLIRQILPSRLLALRS
jgi:hypothetical protein